VHLKHEVLNDTMEEAPFISEALLLGAECFEIGSSFRDIVIKETHLDPACRQKLNDPFKNKTHANDSF
jgi:hypothetical protein